MRYNEEQYLQHACSIQSNMHKLWAFHSKSSVIDKGTLFSIFSYNLIENACKTGVSLDQIKSDFETSLETFYEIQRVRKVYD